MTRDMRWDEFFQKQAKDSEDEEDTSEEVDGDNEMEERVLKDRVRKCNLPRGHRPPQAQLDFESANRLNLLSPRNLKKISLNSEGPGNTSEGESTCYKTCRLDPWPNSDGLC